MKVRVSCTASASEATGKVVPLIGSKRFAEAPRPSSRAVGALPDDASGSGLSVIQWDYVRRRQSKYKCAQQVVTRFTGNLLCV